MSDPQQPSEEVLKETGNAAGMSAVEASGTQSQGAKESSSQEGSSTGWGGGDWHGGRGWQGSSQWGNSSGVEGGGSWNQKGESESYGKRWRDGDEQYGNKRWRGGEWDDQSWNRRGGYDSWKKDSRGYRDTWKSGGYKRSWEGDHYQNSGQPYKARRYGKGKGSWGYQKDSYDESKPVPPYFPDRNILKTDIIKHVYEFPRAENPDRDFMRNLPQSSEPCEKCKAERRQCICEIAGKLGLRVHRRDSGITEEVQEAKTRLNETKSKLDGLDLEPWKAHTRETLVTSFVVRQVRDYSQAELCTNAWCKMMEMLEAMPLIPKDICKGVEEGGDGGVNGNIRTMHLCECPGGFISATNHHLKTKHPNMDSWQWMAITLNPYFEGNTLTAMIDDDAFYRETYLKWSTGVDDSGNVMSYRNVRDLVERAKRKEQVCDVVTADGSVDTQFDANNQERITTRLHFSELVAALGLLRTGGSLVLKMFTLFEPSTKSIIWLIRAMFDRCIVCKPEMSKPGNSEVYVVGLGFGFVRSAVLNRLMGLMEDSDLWKGIEAGDEEGLERAIVPDEWMSPVFNEAFSKCSVYFSTQQTEYIERNLRLFNDWPEEERQLIKAKKRSYPWEFIERLDLRRLKKEDKIVPDPAIPLDKGGNINSTRSLPTGDRPNKSGTQSSRAEFRRLYDETQEKRATLAKEKGCQGFVPVEGAMVPPGQRGSSGADADPTEVSAVGSTLSKALLEKSGLVGEGLKRGNPVIEVENRHPADHRGLGYGEQKKRRRGNGDERMRAKEPMRVAKEVENTLLGKLCSGDYLKEAWFTECGVPLEPYEVKLSKFADSDILDKVIYHRTDAVWEKPDRKVEVPMAEQDELAEIREVVELMNVPVGERILEINPANATESVVECERIVRCELGTSTSVRLPDMHKDVIALLPSEATSEDIDTVFVRITRDAACPYPLELTEYELHHRREWLGPIIAAMNCHPHRALVIGLPQSTLLTRWSAGILQILSLAFYHTQLVTPEDPVTKGAWIVCTHRGFDETIRDSVPYRACRQFLQCLYDATTMTEARGGFIPNVLPPPYFTQDSFARYICDFNREVLTTECEQKWVAASTGVYLAITNFITSISMVFRSAFLSWAFFFIGKAEDDIMDDDNIHELLAHRARAPGFEDEVHNLVREYPDMGSESELIQMLSKVDSRAEMTLFHKNRRRKNDSPERACEERGTDPDGDDDDCHKRRYEMIKAMLQPMKEIHQDNAQLQSETHSLEERWKLANAELEEAMGLTYGPGFTRENPSKNSGLVSEFGLLAGSLLSLKDAAVAAADEAWAELDKVHYGIIVDVDTMKGEVDKRMDTLVKGVQFQSTMQAESQMQNMVDLNKLGNKYMKETVKSINDGQVPVEQGLKQTMKARDTMERSTTGFLSDAEDLLDDLSSEVEEVPEVAMEAREKAETKAEQEVDKAKDEIDMAADHALNEFVSQTDGKTDKIMEVGEKQIEDLSTEAREHEEARRKDGESKVEQQNEEVESLQTEIHKKYENAEERADQRVESFRNETEKPLTHESSFSGDLDDAIKKVEGMLSNFEEAVQTGTSQLQQESRESLDPLRKSVAKIHAASGAHAVELFTQMDNSLMEANRDIASTSRLEMQKVMGKVVDLKKNLGLQNSKLSGLLAQLSDALRNGEYELAAELSMQHNALQAEMSQTSAALQEAMFDLSHKMAQEGAALKADSYAAGREISSNISRGVRDTEDKMKGVLRDLENTEAGVELTMDENKRAHLNAINHAMMSAKGVDAALAGIDREEHAIKSDLMTQQRNSKSVIGHLGQSISRREAAFLREVARVLATSESNAKRAMEEEGNEAKRGFGQVASEAAHEIQSYEAENYRAERDLKSKMNMNSQRARSLGLELSDIERDVQKVMGEKVKDLSEEKEEYTADLQRQTLNSDREVESLMGHFAQSQEKIEKDVREALKSSMDKASERNKEVLVKAQAEVAAGQKEYLEDKSRSTVMTKKLEADSSRFQKHSEKSEKEMEEILRGIEASKSMFADESRGLMKEFVDISGNEEKRITEKTVEIEKKMADLPHKFDTKEFEKEALKSTEDIDLRITQLEERANTAETQEEREEAEKGIEMMKKLKKLADKDRVDDEKLKSKLIESEDNDIERTEQVQESMKNITNNLETIETSMNGGNNDLTDELREFSKRNTGLISGAEGAVSEAESILARELQQSRASAKFDIETKQIANGRLLDRTEAERNHSAVLARHEQAVFMGLEHASKNNISRVFEQAAKTKMRMAKMMGDVMSELARVDMKFESAETGDSSDIGIRLAHTRQAMKSILQLWDQHSLVMGKNLKRFQNDDTEFIEQLSMRLHQEMLKAENILRKSNESVNSLHRKLNMGYTKSKEFEASITDDIAKIRAEEARINNRTQTLVAKIKDQLGETMQKQDDLDQKALQTARTTVQNFENDITQKADEALASIRLTSNSVTPAPAASPSPSGPGGGTSP
ncbi:FtsJ methyltransferase domain containing 1 [Perkinsus chesapeaki]|uniref:Cap-specific mRNA (nucleoside-2'-O-)-methyltransferase 2 n=1 Tax=Perkinsus chesapeaki TaxID=330153 RepID=A0A7J6N304_PERCH|nr:FtsJ methyltransferase domain containing 1 [Perkinsus chesapeaki]